MNILFCENRLDSKCDFGINNILVECKKQFKYDDYKEDKSDKDIIYTCKKENDILCLRTVVTDSLPEDKWIEKMRDIINTFCEEYSDGYVILHLGLGGRDKANYVRYPVIRAVLESKVEHDHVIVYTSYIYISPLVFTLETSKDFNLIPTKKMSTLIKKIKDIMKEKKDNKDKKNKKGKKDE